MQRIKKVAILALHLGFGGGESAVCNLSNMLCDDFEVEIVSFYKLSDNIPFPLDDKIKVNYLSNLKPNAKEFIADVKKLRLLSAFIKGTKSIKILFLRKYLVKEYVKNSDADIIISTRFLYNKILGNNKKQNVVTIAQEHRHHNNDKSYIKKLIKSVEKIDYFMPVSQELADFYNDKVESKCVYISHSLDISAFSKKKYYLGNEVVAIGRLSKEKGFTDLIDIMQLAVKFMPDLILHIFGDGNEYNVIKEKINIYNLSDNVILHGFQSKNDIREILPNCSLYLMTSYSESFGLVLIEAMAYKLPCIAFDTASGAHEIIKNNFNGVLIENRDKEKFASKVIELLHNKKLIKEMSENAFNSSKDYSYNIIKQKNIDFFKKIIKINDNK